jgi:hypothetical protein
MGASHASKGGRRWRYYVSRAALSGHWKEAGSVVRIRAQEIENRVANAVGAHLAARASAIDGSHIGRGGGQGDYAISQHESGHTRRGPPSGNDVRNAIDCATVSATRIEIVLNESIVVDRQDRVLTLPWTRVSSRRRREIIQGVGEAQRPLRAMRTKARDSFIRALRDARRWLHELLIDPAQTIESLAMREHKSERSIRMTVSLAFVFPRSGASGTGGSPSTRVQRQAADRPPNAMVRAMARSRAARADSGSGPTRLIHASSTACERYTHAAAVSVQPLPSCSLGNRILRAETGGRIQALSAGERPEIDSQTGPRPANLPELREFLPPGKPGRFAQTAWWSVLEHFQVWRNRGIPFGLGS